MKDHTKSAAVAFLPTGKQGRVAIGTSVLDAARQLGVELDAPCGGQASCGRCQIQIVDGKRPPFDLHSSSDHVSEISAAERGHAVRHPPQNGRRLACQTLIVGDAIVEVPAESQLSKPLVRKNLEAADLELDPPVRLYRVKAPPSETAHAICDLRRLRLALESQWQVATVQAGIGILPVLQRELHAGNGEVTVAIRDGEELIGVWAKQKEELFGVAVDVGTTTIAVHLCSLRSGQLRASAGLVNPQISFGDDLMSRVASATQSASARMEMTRVVRDAINRLLAQVTSQARISLADVVEMTVAANPVMHHLLLGLDPSPLGVAPFAPVIDSALHAPTSALQLSIHPQGRIYALPCIAGHVGADSAAVMLAECMDADERTSLVVDIGTNAEIILAQGDRLLATSSPTGPALEGAQIGCGQRAAPGAIERVRIDSHTLEPMFKVIGCDLWSNQPGFEDAIGATGVTGICGSGIIEAVAEMFLSGIIAADGRIDGGLRDRSRRIVASGRAHAYILSQGQREIVIDQNDVRSIQLAKAALYAGAQLLLEQLRVDQPDAQIDRIRLAGGFGSFIDVRHAMTLGMIPDCDLQQVSAAGNAASTGARIALLNRGMRGAIEAAARRVEKIESATAPSFQKHFVDALSFPHRTHAFSHLAKVMKLPQRDPPAPAGRRRRRHNRTTTN